MFTFRTRWACPVWCRHPPAASMTASGRPLATMCLTSGPPAASTPTSPTDTITRSSQVLHHQIISNFVAVLYFVHCKRRLAAFPSTAEISIPAVESLISDIPSGDGNVANLFLQCRDLKFCCLLTLRYSLSYSAFRLLAQSALSELSDCPFSVKIKNYQFLSDPR